MALPLLPDELMLSLNQQWPCRDLQLRQLSALLSPNLPSHDTLVLYGTHATGKSGLLKSYLKASGLKHAWINCRECVTGRHLLEQIVAAVVDALPNVHHTDGTAKQFSSRCENLSALVVRLQKLLADREGKFVLALDDIDKQREPPQTLLPALARFGEFVPGLTVVLVVQHPPPNFLHRTGVPHVHFKPYSRNQSIHIVSQKPPDIFLEPPPDEVEYDDDVHEEDKAWLWPRFCAAVWDALGEAVARDLVSFQAVCHKLWRPFVAPVVNGEFGTRDFSRLLVAQRRIFQDESVLMDSLLPSLDNDTFARGPRSHESPYYAKWVLLAGYLASFNPARADELYFMKSTEKKRRKKGGGTSRPGGRPSQVRKMPRHLLAASPFPLDRLLSILHAILPQDVRTGVDIYKQIATLTSQRLLVRAGGIGSSDALEPGGKWRLGPMVTWEYALSMARTVDFDLADYVMG